MPAMPTIDDIVRLSQLQNFIKDELLKALKTDAGQMREVCVEKPQRIMIDHLLSLEETLPLKQQLVFTEFTDAEARDAGAPPPPKRVTYIVRPSAVNMKRLAVRLMEDKKQARSVHVRLIPRKDKMAEMTLNHELLELGATAGQQNVYLTYIEKLENLECGLIPIEGDFLEMGMPDVYRELALNGHSMSLAHVAEALMTFQVFYGEFPVVRGKGNHAQKVAELLQRLKVEQAKMTQETQTPQVDALYIFDREVDPYTPLLVQTTYEGALDEKLGIPFQRLHVEKDEVDQKSGDRLLTAGETLHLTQEVDAVWKDVRGCSMAHIGKELRRILGEIGQQFGQKDTMREMTQREMLNFTTATRHNMQRKKQVQRHISIARGCTQFYEMTKVLEFQDSVLKHEDETQCMEYIEELIYKQAKPELVLQLLSLHSSFFNGIPPNWYKTLHYSLQQTYGIAILTVLENFKRLGLIRKKGRVGQLAQYVGALMNSNHTDDDDNKNDLSYAYRGYTSSLVKLAELLLMGKLDWNGASGFLKDLPGATFGPADGLRQDGQPRTIMLFYIGGITKSEIAGLRLIAEQAKEREGFGQTRLLIATTTTINGKAFVQELFAPAP